MKRPPFIVVLARLAFLAFLSPLLAATTSSQRDLVAEAKIEAQLAALNPALVAPFRDARIALDKNDDAEAARLLAPLCEQAPTFDPALRRLGGALARLGRQQEGIAWAEQALSVQRSAANLSTLAQILAFSRKGEPTRTELERALTLLNEASKLPDGQDQSTLASATQVALQLENYAVARATLRTLEEKFPDAVGTHYYAAVLAAIDERWVRAADEIRRAEKLGLSPEVTQRFLDSGIQSRATAWRFIHGAGGAIGAWAAGLTLLCILGFVLSKATLAQIERADPAQAITPGEHRLRRLYRAVLNVAGLYYYISLPVVMLLVIGAAGAIFYGFLVIGWIPIKLTIILAIGALATIYTMGRSLFLKVDRTDPGRALAADEAEGLWRLTREVADTLQTRPIDEIRLTPGTDLCVYERGTWREKMENRATRVLVVGAAVLNDFKQEDFRSVLAHEYGHFSNRDTAGGDVALRVQNDMMKFYVAMVQAGQATWLNVAFHFLRLYHFIFRRISHGATRLQEVLADRVAAQHYGAAAFEGGLRHVIRRSIEFNARADAEIDAALKANRPVLNLYEAPAAPLAEHEEIYTKEIDRDTTADDTHPSPRDRFRLVARVPAPPRTPVAGIVWDLFKDRTAVLREMMETVEKNIASHRG